MSDEWVAVGADTDDGGDWTPVQAAPVKPTSAELEQQMREGMAESGSRFATGLADPVVALGQLADIPIDLVRQKLFPGATNMNDVVRERDANYKAPEGFDAARMVGNVANPLTLLAPEAAAATTLPRIAGFGAVQGLMQPTPADQSIGEFAVSKGKQGATGAGLSATMAKLLRGATPTKEAQQLIEKGVQPSFGQSMGPHSFANSLEEKLQSVPILGGQIQRARTRPVEEWQQKILERATGTPGIQTVDQANTHIDDAYTTAKQLWSPNENAKNEITKSLIKSLQNPELTQEGQQRLAKIMESKLGIYGSDADRFDKLNGDQLKALHSELWALANKYKKSPYPSEQSLGDEIMNVRSALAKGLSETLPPEQQGLMAQADDMFRQMVPVNRAASANADGEIYPRALQTQLARQAGRDVSRQPYNGLINPAVAVLRNRVPDSGTAGRQLASQLVAGNVALPITAALYPLTGAGASRTGQAAMTGSTRGQKAAVPYSQQMTAALLAALRNRPQQPQGIYPVDLEQDQQP